MSGEIGGGKGRKRLQVSVWHIRGSREKEVREDNMEVGRQQVVVMNVIVYWYVFSINLVEN